MPEVFYFKKKSYRMKQNPVGYNLSDIFRIFHAFGQGIPFI